MEKYPIRKMQRGFFKTWATAMVRDHLNGLDVGNCKDKVIELLAQGTEGWYNKGQHDLMNNLDANILDFWSDQKLKYSKSPQRLFPNKLETGGNDEIHVGSTAARKHV